MHGCYGLGYVVAHLRYLDSCSAQSWAVISRKPTCMLRTQARIVADTVHPDALPHEESVVPWTGGVAHSLSLTNSREPARASHSITDDVRRACSANAYVVACPGVCVIPVAPHTARKSTRQTFICLDI